MDWQNDSNNQPHNDTDPNGTSGNNGFGGDPYGFGSDPYGPGNWNPYRRVNPEAVKGQGFLTAALVCGVLTIVTTVLVTVYLPFVFGGLSIIFACLSRVGDTAKLAKQAKTGILCAVIGLVMNTSLIVGSISLVFNHPEYRQQLNELCEEMYGDSFDNMFNQMMEQYGISLPEEGENL